MWFFCTEGKSHVGQLKDLFFPKNKNFSLDTFVLTGAPCSFHCGNNSSKALVSKTLPLKMCAPTSDPFSNMQTFKLESSCFNLIAVDNPAGPAPTIWNWF